jgi:PleD family two-component response regulator
VAIRKALELLLVESNPEDEQLICEALIEIDEGRHWHNWSSCELVHVDQLSHALDCLRQASFDVVLIDLDLPDGDTLLESFYSIHVAAKTSAVVVMIDEEDQHLANRLLHEGAQDVLLKLKIECESLANSIRFAVERQRRANALESVAVFDELTGLYNPRGFAIFAEHDIQVARRTGYPLVLAVFEVIGFPEHLTLKQRDDRDLLLIRAAELLRTLFGEASLVGRLDAGRFGIFTMDGSEGGVERLAETFESELYPLWGSQSRHPLSIRTGVATFCPERKEGLEELLAEAQNGLVPKTAILAV